LVEACNIVIKYTLIRVMEKEKSKDELKIPSLSAISDSLKCDAKFNDIHACLQAELIFIKQKFNLLEKELKNRDNLRHRTEKNIYVLYYQSKMN